MLPDQMLKLLKNKQVKETVWSLSSRAYTMAVTFVINIILPRGLGPELFGAWAFFFSIFAAALTGSSKGIDRASRTFVARHRDTARVRSVIIDSLKLGLGFSATAAVVLALLAPLLANVFKRPELASLLLWGAPLLFFGGMIEYLRSYFIGMHRLKFAFILDAVEVTVKLLAVVAVVRIFTLTLVNVTVAFNVAAIAAVAVGGLMLWRLLPSKDNDERFTADIFWYSMPLLFLSIGSLMMGRLNTIMLGIFSGDKEVAFFSVTANVIIGVPTTVSAIAIAAGPLFAKNESHAFATRTFRRLTQAALLIILPPTLLLIFAAKWIVPLVWGRQYMPAVPPLQIMSVYMFFSAFSLVANEVLDYRGLARLRARNLVVAIVLNVLLNLWLIPRYGAIGAAIGQTIAFIPYVGLNFYEVRRAFFRDAQREKPPTP